MIKKNGTKGFFWSNVNIILTEQQPQMNPISFPSPKRYKIVKSSLIQMTPRGRVVNQQLCLCNETAVHHLSFQCNIKRSPDQLQGGTRKQMNRLRLFRYYCMSLGYLCFFHSSSIPSSCLHTRLSPVLSISHLFLPLFLIY